MKLMSGGNGFGKFSVHQSDMGGPRMDLNSLNRRTVALERCYIRNLSDWTVVGLGPDLRRVCPVGQLGLPYRTGPVARSRAMRKRRSRPR
jgi:hypothetical protein